MPLLSRIALASLVALIVVSIALVAVALPAPDGHGLPPGAMLALVKVAALGFVGYRVWNHHVYALQWSSMFILLFVAEGTVRAVSDPPWSAAFGCIEAVTAAIYFAAVLAILRPLKKEARTEAARR